MARLLQTTKMEVRHGAARLAAWLDKLSGGRLTPDMVTYLSLVMHVPVGLLIASDHYLWAAGLLVVFGLADTLDGELARYQQRAGPRGMLLDASSDRFKEVIVYTAVGYTLATGPEPATAAWAVAATGAALCVSYVKAKGEAVVANAGQGKRIPHDVLNRVFADGLLTFEIRMAVLTAGLIFDRLLWAMVAIAVLAAWTAVQRLVRIGRQL